MEADVPKERRAGPTPRTREIPRPPRERGSVINRRPLNSSLFLSPSGFTQARNLFETCPPPLQLPAPSLSLPLFP